MNQKNKWLINLLQVFTDLLKESDLEFILKTQVEVKMLIKKSPEVKGINLYNKPLLIILKEKQVLI